MLASSQNNHHRRFRNYLICSSDSRQKWYSDFIIQHEETLSLVPVSDNHFVLPHMGQISGGGDSMGDESGVSDWQAARADTFSLAGRAVKFLQEVSFSSLSTKVETIPSKI